MTDREINETLGAVDVLVWPKNIPNGFTIRFTHIEIDSPTETLSVSLYINGQVYTGGYINKKIDQDLKEGYALRIYMKNSKAFSSAQPPNILIKFAIDSDHSDFDTVYGDFRMTTSDWGRIERPDYVYLYLNLLNDNKRPVHCSSTVHDLGSTDPFFIYFEERNRTVALIASVNESITRAALDLIFEGVKNSITEGFVWVLEHLLFRPK